METPTRRERGTAGVVLVSHVEGERRVFWSRRPADRDFLAGFRSFFVGGLESGDEGVPVDTVGSSSVPSRAHWGAVARELFEETGLLPLDVGWLASWRESARSNPPLGSWSEFRRRVADDPASFGRLLVAADLTVDGKQLRSVGAWRAPVVAGYRTTTEFFVASLPPAFVEGVVEQTSAEHEDGEWVAPREAIGRWRDGCELLSTPIRHLLEGLGASDDRRETDPFSSRTRRGRAEERGMEVVGGVRSLPLGTSTPPPFRFTNCYIVGERRLVVVDPGTSMAGERAILEEALGGLRAEGAAVEAVALTHHHRDHVEAAPEICARFDAPILAHPEAARRLEGIAVDETYTEGVRLLEGTPHALEILETPGHGPGHVAMVHERSNGLIAGDLVAGEGTVVVDPDDGSMSDYLASLRRVHGRDPRWLFPAHGPTIVRPRAHLEELLEHRRWREEKVERALERRAGWVEPQELVSEVYDETPVSRWPMARRSLTAHLRHLVTQGKAETREGRDLYRARSS